MRFHGWPSLCQKAFFLIATLVATRFAAAADPESSIELQRFPIELEGAIIVPLEVFGETHSFVLDTGAAFSVFDSQLRDQLGQPKRKKNLIVALLTRKAQFHQCPEMKIGDKLFQSSKSVLSIDLSEARRASGEDLTGILGVDFLKSHVIRVNFDEGFAAIQSAVTSAPAHVQPIELDNWGRPRIKATVSDGALQEFIIDTGNTTALSLRSSEFEKLVQRKRIVLRGTTQVAKIPKTRTEKTGVLDQIELGPYRIRNVCVQESSFNLMGLQFLERFDVELDLPNAQAHFRPGRRLHMPDRWNIAGIGIDQNEGKTLIHHVESQSVSEQAGIVKGDQILEVNNVPVAEISMARFHQLRAAPETELNLKISHKGKVKNVVLKLPEQVDPFPTQTASREMQKTANGK